MGKWIRFEVETQRPKTTIWRVVTTDGVKIGLIKWYGPWRKYSLFPLPETVWEPTCLNDVVEFIKAEMLKRKYLNV
jgi:hypothetical protein